MRPILILIKATTQGFGFTAGSSIWSGGMLNQPPWECNTRGALLLQSSLQKTRRNISDEEKWNRNVIEYNIYHNDHNTSSSIYSTVIFKSNSENIGDLIFKSKECEKNSKEVSSSSSYSSNSMAARTFCIMFPRALTEHFMFSKPLTNLTIKYVTF